MKKNNFILKSILLLITIITFLLPIETISADNTAPTPAATDTADFAKIAAKSQAAQDAASKLADAKQSVADAQAALNKAGQDLQASCAGESTGACAPDALAAAVAASKTTAQSNLDAAKSTLTSAQADLTSANSALASVCGGSTTGACAAANPADFSASNDECVSDSKYTMTDTGKNMILSIFNAINTIMQDMAKEFYNNIIASPTYTAAVNSAIILYITIYGVMIMFNLAPYNAAEVYKRLIKIAIIWGILSGWGFFDHRVATPVLGAINELITGFSQAATTSTGNNCAYNAGFTTTSTATTLTTTACTDSNGNQGVLNVSGSCIAAVSSSGILSADSMSSLYSPLACMFSAKYEVAILCFLFLGFYGWIFSIILIWGLIQFLLTAIGAMLTYIKSIVGLAFLLGLSPIFFPFIMFEKTRQIFMGWVNQVLAFALQPVLLFAFLGFYSMLIDGALYNMLFSPDKPDICWAHWLGVVGNLLDLRWWRPKPVGGTAGGDWIGAPPISMSDVLYFLLLVHLAKNFIKFIDTITQTISGGSTPGVVSGGAVGGAISNQFFGGRGIGGFFADGAAGVGGWARNKMNNGKPPSFGRGGVGGGYSDAGGGIGGGGASVMDNKESFIKGVKRDTAGYADAAPSDGGNNNGTGGTSTT